MGMCIGYNIFTENRWSETATMLSFSPATFETALSVMRKTVKLTFPVLRSHKAGVCATFAIRFVGFVLTPERFMIWLNLPPEFRYCANLLSALLSLLQHATYTMHNFGYDLLLRFEVSYAVFAGLTIGLGVLAYALMKRFSSHFTGGMTDE